MIALPSFLAALDKPQAKPVVGDAGGAEGAEIVGNDGFAALIAQLVQIAPLFDQQSTGAELLPADDQGGNLPTGKILPVDGGNFAVATAPPQASQIFATASPLPVSAALTGSSATILSFQHSQTPQVQSSQVSAQTLQAQPAQTASVVKPGEPMAQAATVVETASAPAREATGNQPAARADQIRLAVVVAPAGSAALGASAPQHASAPVEQQLSAAFGAIPKPAHTTFLPLQQPHQSGLGNGAPRLNGQVAGSIATEPKQVGREPQPATGTVPDRALSVKPASLERDAGSGERSNQSSTFESSTGVARMAGLPESAKPFAMPVVAALDAPAAQRSESVRTVAAAPTTALTAVETIERLVERLSAAREYDMAKPASIAVAHREFGALTVTFDNARSGLDVEIAAKDGDMQRALAQAVAADRPNARAGEPLQQSSQQQASQAASTGSERGAGSTGQGATSSGPGSEGDRSQHQRDRNLASSPKDLRNPAAPSTGDDALYA